MTLAQSPQDFRRKCRTAEHVTQTSGCCPGYIQANLVILPSHAAQDFKDLCMRNPVPCPLLGMTRVGDSGKIDNPVLLDDDDFDIRADFPRYSVYVDGLLESSPTDIRHLWTDDHVGFLLGCSFSFENALTEAGLPPRNQVAGTNVSMYITTKLLDSAGIFSDAPYVVSMRPYKAKDIEKVRQITREFRKCHGEPIDWGFGAVERLGIKDIDSPEFGDSTVIADDEVPVFWGCGVTAQTAAVRAAKRIRGPVIGHLPGHMIVLDVKDEDVVKL